MTTLSREEMGELIHELEVYTIELEMQNDELCAAQEELEISRRCYFDLYNIAPVGYCVLNENGVILDLNLTAVTLLGRIRSDLINRPISMFILKADYYNSGNGFLFNQLDAGGLMRAIDNAMIFYNLPRDIKNYQISWIMKQSRERFDHAVTAEQYLLLYEKMLKRPVCEPIKKRKEGIRMKKNRTDGFGSNFAQKAYNF